MVSPISSQSNIASLVAAQVSSKPEKAAQAPAKAQNAPANAAPAPAQVTAPYSPIKEKLETASQETKESANVKASEALRNLANAETAHASAAKAPENQIVNTQQVVQAYTRGATPPVL